MSGDGNGRLTVEKIMRYLAPIAVVAGAAALWDISGSIREIRTVLVYQGKQRDEDKAATAKDIDELKGRVRALEAK